MGIANCITVNADYESVLFHGKSGPAAMNHALEFLGFFLQDLPVLTSYNYSQEYLRFVRELSGKEPSTVTTGNAINWWGPLTDLPLEQYLNSKLTSAELVRANGWADVRIVAGDELTSLKISKPIIAKDPYGMSGRGLFTLNPGEIPQLKQVPDKLIIEPLLRRKYDFSHFVFPDGRVIGYENLVDERFQYRGTLIQPLSFRHLISEAKWSNFERQLALIIDHYGTKAPYGYSIDSFVYDDEGELRIYPLCEVNARRTMGLMAFALSELLNPGGKSALTLKSKLSDKAVKLSPEGTRFEIYFNYL